MLRLLDFLVTYQIDPSDGIWPWSVDAAGRPLSTTRASEWKAAYHDLRAIVRFCRALCPRRGAPFL